MNCIPNIHCFLMLRMLHLLMRDELSCVQLVEQRKILHRKWCFQIYLRNIGRTSYIPNMQCDQVLYMLVLMMRAL